MESTARPERQYLWGDREGLASGSRMFICEGMVIFQRDEVDPYPHHYEVRVFEEDYRRLIPLLEEHRSIQFRNPDWVLPHFILEMSLCPRDPKMVRICLHTAPFPMTTPNGSELPRDLDFNIALCSLAPPALQPVAA